MIEQVGRWLLLVGLVTAGIGLVLILAGRLGLGRLPGDLVWRGENWTVYVPLGWMIVLSVLLTIVLNIVARR